MKRLLNNIKKTPKWCYITLIVIMFLGMNMHITSIVTKNVVNTKMENVSEMKIKNQHDFIELQNYFQNRFDADASVTYLLQPKDYIKLYKELIHTNVNDSLYLSAPYKVSLADERKYQSKLKGNEFVKIKLDSDVENYKLLDVNCDFKTAYAFPIYHYRTHVSEFIIFFKDDVNLANEQIIEIRTELQSLAQYIK